MPKKVTPELRQCIKKCYKELKLAYEDNPNILETIILLKMSHIFNLHINTIRNIINEEDDREFPSVGRRKKTLTIDDFIFRKDLQRQILNYNLKNEQFSIDTLLTYAKENLDYDKGRTSLFKILKSMGYKYERVRERKILCEQKQVVAAKITFLRKFLEFKSLGENIKFVFLDETWIYQKSSSVDTPTLESDTIVIKGEGKRFTFLHAGSDCGFLEGCNLILNSVNNDNDYNKRMTSEIFPNWITYQLIPALRKIPGKCVIVMDNAPYHSLQLDKPPKINSVKREMQDWLIRNRIDFDQNFNRKQLWQLITSYRNDRQKRYVVDNILREHGHEVLRLPIYHCQYNPIEMAWAFCKNFYYKNLNSQPYTEDRMLSIWNTALSNCTTDLWQNFYSHCERLITQDWTKHMGNLPTADLPPFIISLGESDSDTELSGNESDSVNEVMDVE